MHAEPAKFSRTPIVQNPPPSPPRKRRDERPLERFPTVRYRKGSAETRLKIRFNLLRQKCLSRTDLCAFRADRSGSFLNCWRRALFQCASIVMNIMLDISDARLIVR